MKILFQFPAALERRQVNGFGPVISIIQIKTYF